jgi:site-specific recombinase XerD
MRNYFSDRDKANNDKLSRIVENDLPPFCEEYFVGIENNTTALTRLNYAYDLRVFFDFMTKRIARFRQKQPQELTIDDVGSLTGFEIEKFLSTLSFYTNSEGKELKNREEGKLRKLSAIRALVKYFEKKQVLKHNPTASVTSPKLHSKEIVRLDAAEIEGMIDVVDGGLGMTERQQKYQENTRVRDLAIIALMLGTGVRVSELVGIDTADIDFDDLSFAVTRKGGARVILYFSDEIAGYLYDYYEIRMRNKKAGADGAFFLSLQNKRITTRAVENIVKKYSSVATPLKHITPHKLRTTFGTQLYRSTGDIYMVADVLGHRDVNTTKRHYAAIGEDVKRKASTKVTLHNSLATYLDDDADD